MIDPVVYFLCIVGFLIVLSEYFHYCALDADYVNSLAYKSGSDFTVILAGIIALVLIAVEYSMIVFQ